MKSMGRHSTAMRAAGLFLGLMLLLAPACITLHPHSAAAAEKRVGMIQVTDTPVNIRSGPGTGYSIACTLSNARVVYVLKSQVSSGRTWYQIALSADGAAKGWVREDLICCVIPVPVDPDFDAYLENQGFPRSYWDNLRILHAVYPNWKFEAVKTGLKWSDVLTAETRGGINLIHPSYYSTYGSKYVDTTNIDANGKQVTYDTGWYKAAPDLVAYYIDPRNFLDDYHIFQFERLTFDADVHSLEGVGAAIQNTFMDGSYSRTVNGKTYHYKEGKFTYPGGTATFKQAIFDLCKKNNISPYHAAIRIRQEMGNNGVSPLAWGAVEGYLGCYNFFNYGAYAANGNGANVNGAIYAKNQGWTNPYAALDGGIQSVGKNYIAQGQNTLYFQKFNVVKSPYYGHQYMTNVMAPTSEALGTAKSVRNCFGSSFATQKMTFRIPIYLNMPENAVENPASTQYVPSSNLVTDSVLASKVYVIRTESITGIPEGTTSETLLGGIQVVLEGGQLHLFDAEGNEKTEGTVVTGDRLQVWDSSDELFREYAVIIYGDVDGNGKISLADLLNVQKHLLNTAPLSEPYLTAADVSRDGKVATLDLLNVQKHLLGTTPIKQK